MNQLFLKKKRPIVCFTISAICSIIVSYAFYLSNSLFINDGKTTCCYFSKNVILEYFFVALLIACVTFFFFMIDKKEPINKIVMLVISIVFGILNVTGQNIAYYDDFVFKQGISQFLVFMYCIICYALAFFIIASVVVELLGRISEKQYIKRISERKLFLVSFCTIIITWLVWIIAYYPATVDFDTEWQIASYLGLMEKSNHHPWFSSCLIGSFYKFGHSLGNDNIGMFLYIIFRLIIMAVIYARCILILRTAGVKQRVLIIVLLYYAITPVWGAYAKQPFKDTFAAALFCWFVTESFILLKQIKEEGTPQSISCLALSLSGLLVSLFRNNYCFVVIPISLILIIIFMHKKYKVTKSIVLLFGIIIYLGFNIVITTFFDISPTEKREALSVPFQQTARVVKYYKDDLSKKEIDSIEKILDFNAIGSLYNPISADPVKGTAKPYATNNDYKNYFKTWFNLFYKHPEEYVKATLGLTYGYYTFTKDGFPSGGLGNCGMVVLNDINKDQGAHFDELFDFNYCDKLKQIRSLLEKYYLTWHKIPLINITDNLPFYFWLLVIIIVMCISRKAGIMIIPPIAIAIGLLSCMASPINGSFRYLAPIAASMPVLLAVLSVSEKE